MSYIYENPWPGILLLAVVAVIAFLSAAPRSGIVAIVCLALAVGLYFLEQYLVSPREHVEMELETMLDNFKARDVPAISRQLAVAGRDLETDAERGLDLVELSDSFHIRSAEIEMVSDTEATALVRANGTVTLRKHGSGSQHVATYWKLTWVLEDGVWKLSEVVRLNLTSGEEVDYFSTVGRGFESHSPQSAQSQFRLSA